MVDRFTFEAEGDKLRIMSWTGKSSNFWIENAYDEVHILVANLGG